MATEVYEQWLVLSTLIKGFGGEATCVDLTRHVARQFRSVGPKETNLSLTIRSILHDLEFAGAITLEDVGDTELVARIRLPGIIIANQRPDGDVQPAVTR